MIEYRDDNMTKKPTKKEIETAYAKAVAFRNNIRFRQGLEELPYVRAERAAEESKRARAALYKKKRG